MPRSKTHKAWRAAIRRCFEALAEKLRRDGKTPAAEIARVLNVSRQTAYQYLNGSAIPGDDRLATAIRTWQLSIDYRGQRFDERQFGPPRSGPGPDPEQLEFHFDDLARKPVQVTLPIEGCTLRIDSSGATLRISADVKRSA